MRILLSILLVTLFVQFVQAQDQMLYSKVRISLTGKGIHELALTGVDITEGQYKKDTFFETDLSTDELNRVREAGFTFEVLISDVSNYYRERAEAEKDIQILRNQSVEFPVPQNWGYGSMGGFYTYQQVLDKLDFMAQQWPHLITVRQPINPALPSIQGKPIWFVKISDNVNVTENEPEVLYTSLIHAREGIGVQQMIYYMLYLLENYNTNPNVKAIVDNTEMYFVPVVNPDGYLFNQQNSPTGGGMWRKNRRQNSDATWGVDLNRNFGYKWGLDNTGSSNVPSSETYRGTAAFSEPETSNLRQFCESRNFKIALNYHSYSNLLLYPWGYTSVPTPDNAVFAAHAALMTRDSRYITGPGNTTIYATNGASDDYMYGETLTKNAIFSYTPELGSSTDGFWPAMNRIIPLCQENMIQNVRAAQLAGSFGLLTDKSKQIIPQKQFFLPFELQRFGFGNGNTWTVSIVPLDSWITQTGAPKVIGELNMLQKAVDSIQITLNPSITSGKVFKFLLRLNNGTYTTNDTITKMYGITSVIFSDNCDQMTQWASTVWNTTQSSFVTPTGSITDSPIGNYLNSTLNTITTTQQITIPNTASAKLTFWAKWALETGYDFVQLLVRQSGSINWTPLAGKYTKPGSTNQALGQPMYDGTSNWVLEEVNLSAFAGTSIQLRFQLKSDASVNADGYYFDDLKITVLDVETGIGKLAESKWTLKVFPNPVASTVNIETQAGLYGKTIEIVNIQGKIVQSHQVNADATTAQIAVNGLSAGLYFIRVEGIPESTTKLFIQ